jgi:hypothetical protein
MNTRELTTTLPTLLSELVNGSPDVNVVTYMLNRGDQGLLASLETLSASAASSTSMGGGSIAAHADHIRFGLMLLNRWAAGEEDPWKDADWTASWRNARVTDDEWRVLRADLRREADAWIAALRTAREVPEVALNWIVGSVAHLAYHLGAIRQIDRAARGPTAEDERRVTAEWRAHRSK